MLKVSIVVLTLALALPAFAAAPDKPAPPPKPVEHALHVTDADLSLINFVIQRTGERCAQEAAFCQAQILLNDFGRRVAAQLQAEPKPEPPAKP